MADFGAKLVVNAQPPKCQVDASVTLKARRSAMPPLTAGDAWFGAQVRGHVHGRGAAPSRLPPRDADLHNADVQ